MMLVVLKSILLGVMVPAVVSAVVLFIAHLLGRRSESTRSFDWGLPLAVGLGYLAGHLGIAWPSADVTDRIPWLVLGAIALGTLGAAWPGPLWARWENGLLFSAVALLAMLGPTIQETWGTRETNLWMAALGGGVVLSWANLETLAVRIKGAAFMVPLLAWVGGASAVLLLSGSMVLGRLGGALAAALFGAWTVSWRNSPINLARGVLAVVIVTLAALLLEGHVYAQATTVGVGLIAVAPLLLWITPLGPIQNRRPWLATLLGTVVVLIPIGIATGLALMAESASEY